MLLIDGAVAAPIRLDATELQAALNDATHVNVSQIDARRVGTAVPLSELLDLADVLPDTTHVTFHAADGFAASVPLHLIRDRGLVIYAQDGGPLPESAGGPLRFLVPDAAACKTAEVDACANVKNLARIEMSVGRGADTRDG